MPELQSWQRDCNCSHEHDVAGCTDLGQQARDTALQLAALLGARNEEAQVQLHHPFAPAGTPAAAPRPEARLHMSTADIMHAQVRHAVLSGVARTTAVALSTVHL